MYIEVDFLRLDSLDISDTASKVSVKQCYSLGTAEIRNLLGLFVTTFARASLRTVLTTHTKTCVLYVNCSVQFCRRTMCVVGST